MDATAFDIVVYGFAALGGVASVFWLWGMYCLCTKSKTRG
jgi:hypothetical protein